MDTSVKLYLDRAGNELRVSIILKNLSQSDEKAKFGAEKEDTFYSSVISHSYYSIFYAAKALLLTKGIKTAAPEVHRKTYEKFKKEFVDTGVIDIELMMIYRKMIVRADELLLIFKDEKWKRGHFTYKTIPQANKEPAEESIDNATKFIRNLRAIIER